jgi:peptidoglycan hydrolase-like protein with peptidoglycan-binding domain
MLTIMKPKIFTALTVALALLPAAASFADGGGAYVYATRSFSDNDPHVYGPFREKYSASANTEVQAELTRLGYYHGPIDGNVNPGTQTSVAIASYQRDHRLPVTGVINGGLLASLSGQ